MEGLGKAVASEWSPEGLILWELSSKRGSPGPAPECCPLPMALTAGLEQGQLCEMAGLRAELRARVPQLDSLSVREGLKAGRMTPAQGKDGLLSLLCI